MSGKCPSTPSSNIACMHVLAKSNVPAESFVYGTAGVAPHFIPEVVAAYEEGMVYMGVADKPIRTGQHGTVIVSGVVTLFGEKIPKVVYSIVKRSMISGGDDADDTIIGITVSCVLHGRFDAKKNVLLQGVRVLLCPWMTACKAVEPTKGFLLELFGQAGLKLFMQKTGYKQTSIDCLEQTFAEVCKEMKPSYTTCYLQ